MIILEFKGGIGNQLFQFAHGLQVAHRLGMDVCAIVRFDRIRQGTRPFSSFFRPLRSIVSLPFPVHHMSQKGWTAAANRGEDTALAKLAMAKGGKEIHIFLDGYYQSSKFFANVIPQLVAHLRPHFTCLLDACPIKIPPASLSIHIRRGDYLRYPRHHPFAGIDYYRKALNALDGFDRVFVFSDDLKWCRGQTWLKNLPDTTFVDASGETCLALMSCCDFHVIANSTFSWWGAFLAQQRNPNTRVVAPKQWFGPAIGHNTCDMYEPSWILI